jgi:hypothetical protein
MLTLTSSPSSATASLISLSTRSFKALIFLSTRSFEALIFIDNRSLDVLMSVDTLCMMTFRVSLSADHIVECDAIKSENRFRRLLRHPKYAYRKSLNCLFPSHHWESNLHLFVPRGHLFVTLSHFLETKGHLFVHWGQLLCSSSATLILNLYQFGF